MNNSMHIRFVAKSENEAFARMAVIGFIAYLNPTMEVLEDIKIAISEAVTNAIVHGYQGKNQMQDFVDLHCEIEEGEECYIQVKIADAGVGIADVKKAMEPMYTTLFGEDRAGMGFSFMEAFMDGLDVQSEVGAGTTVTLCKKIK